MGYLTTYTRYILQVRFHEIGTSFRTVLYRGYTTNQNENALHSLIAFIYRAGDTELFITYGGENTPKYGSQVQYCGI